MNHWKAEYDSGTSGTGGSAAGTTSLMDAPSMSGQTRAFATTFTNNGGERYHVTFGHDSAATHFLYDGWVYLDSSVSAIANLEMDIDQTMAGGGTVMFGFQCDGWSKTWDYTTNAGTPLLPVDAWLHSDAACDLQAWSTNTWHHVQVLYSRDDAGNVTYQSVWLDDAEQDIGVTVPSAFVLGWGSDLVTNLQVDGKGASGVSTVYLDDLTVYRW